MALERELETFRTRLPELLRTNANRFVLIHGGDVVSIWDSEREALDAGYDQFLRQAFLVQKIVANEKPIFMP